MRKWATVAATIGAVAILSGCSAGGWIPSAQRQASAPSGQAATQSGKATFGMTYDGNKGRFQGTYRDGSVQMGFNGYSSAGLSCAATSLVQYRSTNPQIPGSGQVYVGFCDNGSSGDNLSVEVISGPYNGYFNAGEVQGSVTAK
jgi:hypothetical protein